MISQFLNFIEENNLISKDEMTLLTVSGGIDSVVMCELFFRSELKFGIAHCNFKLRGDESDGDAQFVKEIAIRYEVPFYSIEFETYKIAKELGISTQMAARDLRYEWFEEIRSENGYQKIATAHHRDDQLETFFINLIRGTGLSGLHGINPKQGKLIRPLLFATRKEIESLLKKHQLKYREDSSNASNKYLRNKIRHQLLPVLEKIDPAYLKIFEANIKRFGESEEIYMQQIKMVRDRIVTRKGKEFFIPIIELKKLKPISTYLFEIIREFGFSFSMCEDIIKSLDNESGKQFYSETHRLLKDRSFLIIRKIELESEKLIYHIEENIGLIEEPVKLKLDKFIKDDEFNIIRADNFASIDYEKLKFPLLLRKWEEGDYFYPLGNNFRKKLSDFFIDRKLSLFEKEDCWLLCSGKDIVWVIGWQLDNRFKITSKTKKIIQIECPKELV